MESSSLRKSSRRMKREKREREKFVSSVISPAIQGQKCPICLDNLSDRRAAVLKDCTHAYCLQCIEKWSNLKRNCPLCNAPFHSWFYKIDLSSSNFHIQQLQPLAKEKAHISPSHSSSRTPDSIIRRSRDEFSSDGGRSRPLPWRRSFGQPGSVPDSVAFERKLRWRASVYNERLRAVPVPSRRCLGLNALENNSAKVRLLQRIDPWIRRELLAILRDPNPSIIVHVVSSLFIECLQRMSNVASRQHGVEDDVLAPLRPFLRHQTDMFWYELRCFAESSLTMDTYDVVVDYRKMGRVQQACEH